MRVIFTKKELDIFKRSGFVVASSYLDMPTESRFADLTSAPSILRCLIWFIEQKKKFNELVWRIGPTEHYEDYTFFSPHTISDCLSENYAIPCFTIQKMVEHGILDFESKIVLIRNSKENILKSPPCLEFFSEYLKGVSESLKMSEESLPLDFYFNSSSKMSEKLDSLFSQVV